MTNTDIIEAMGCTEYNIHDMANSPFNDLYDRTFLCKMSTQEGKMIFVLNIQKARSKYFQSKNMGIFFCMCIINNYKTLHPKC